MNKIKNMDPSVSGLPPPILIGIQAVLTIASVTTGGFAQMLARAASEPGVIVDFFFFFFIGLVGVGALIASFFIKKK